MLERGVATRGLVRPANLASRKQAEDTIKRRPDGGHVQLIDGLGLVVGKTELTVLLASQDTGLTQIQKKGESGDLNSWHSSFLCQCAPVPCPVL